MDFLFDTRFIGFLILLFVIFQVIVLYRVLKMTEDVSEIKKYIKSILDQKKEKKQ